MNFCAPLYKKGQESSCYQHGKKNAMADEPAADSGKMSRDDRC